MLGVVVKRISASQLQRFYPRSSTDAPDGDRARARFCVRVSYAVAPAPAQKRAYDVAEPTALGTLAESPRFAS